MLCLDMRLIHRMRGENLEDIACRDRSKSVCVSTFSNEPPHSVGIIELFHRRASSAISTATEFISRRGIFSRKFYGSSEHLQEFYGEDSEKGRKFRLENGNSQGEMDEMFGSPKTPVLENPEYHSRWYFKHFLGKLHQNYAGVDGHKLPFFLSVVLEESSNQGVPLYRAILFTKSGSQKISLPYVPNKILTVKQILSNFTNMDKLDKGPKEIFAPDIQKDLLLLEEQEGSVNFKFGVIYMKSGQITDDEILSNETGSPRFEKFLSLLGEKIVLKGWEKYKGGLDVKSDMTGKYSVYTMYEGHEIMFHVSTYLPYSRDNKQQVERKRHIGNDIVNIVFIDDGDGDAASNNTNFDPTIIKSQFTHIFAVVSKTSNNKYRLSMFSDEAVPLFGPSLPNPPIFEEESLFRDFLLVKLINGEKAAFDTPIFAQKRERTLDMLIKDLYSDYVVENKSMLNRRAFSDILAEGPKNMHLKEDTRQIEFIRIGQALKLEAIVRGDAPTSLASAGITGTIFKRSPWDAVCFYPTFPNTTVIDADSWNNNRLIIATDEGVFLVEEGRSHQLIFDRSLQVYQLNVVEPHGILLLRAGQSCRDGKVYVFRLSDVERYTKPLGRLDVKNHKIEISRGTHLYVLSKTGWSKLHMCVSIGRRIIMFQWKHSVAWTAWCPNSDTDTVDGFVNLWEVTLTDVPSVITILDNVSYQNSTPACDVHVCVGYKNQWDIINVQTGYSQHLFSVKGEKTNLITAFELYEDHHPQLLLCYNNTCHLKKVNFGNDKANNEFTFYWSFVPNQVVCIFPYVVGIATNTMEFRLIINGHLVHSITMPNLQIVAFKNEVFFTTTAPEFIEQVNKHLLPENISKAKSPVSSGATDIRPLRIFKLSAHPFDKKIDTLEKPTVSSSVSLWKDMNTRLNITDNRRVVRSVTSSPVPSFKYNK